MYFGFSIAFLPYICACRCFRSPRIRKHQNHRVCVRSRLCVQFGFAAHQQICNSRIRWTDSGYSNGLCGICLYGLAYKKQGLYQKGAYTYLYVGYFRSRPDVFRNIYCQQKSGETDTLFMDYTSIACLPMSAAVFTAAKYIKWERLFRVIPENS